MSILAYGLNYRTAPLDLRERVAFPEDTLARALREVVADIPAIREAAILSTCNRTELYCATNPGVDADIASWLAERRDIHMTELEAATYQHWDTDAAKHIIRVASGLDSQVLGEPQIMGQVKTAYELARQQGTLGPELNLLSLIIMRSAKEVRTQTEVGKNPVSVAFAAVALAQQIFSTMADKHVLLLGAGEMIDLVAEHLRSKGVQSMAIANRTLANAEVLASKHGARAMQLTDVAEQLADFDIVIASTGASLPVVGKGAVEAAIKARRRSPIFMVDIAVPRDIEAGVAELPDVYLYTIDDLTQIIEANIAQRREAAAQAETLVTVGAQTYQRERRVQMDQGVLRAFRTQAKNTEDEELAKAMRDLQRGVEPELVLKRFSHSLTNKLIHTPTAAIREASAEGRSDLLEYAREIFGLEQTERTDIDPSNQD